MGRQKRVLSLVVARKSAKVAGERCEWPVMCLYVCCLVKIVSCYSTLMLSSSDSDPNLSVRTHFIDRSKHQYIQIWISLSTHCHQTTVSDKVYTSQNIMIIEACSSCLSLTVLTPCIMLLAPTWSVVSVVSVHTHARLRLRARGHSGLQSLSLRLSRDTGSLVSVSHW